MVFKIVTINIIVMMVTNSCFSAISPYLWLGDVYARNQSLVNFYLASTTLFYLANTFFSILLLYVIHRFGLDGTNDDNSEDKSAFMESSKSEDEGLKKPVRKSPYLSIADTENIIRSSSADYRPFTAHC